MFARILRSFEHEVLIERISWSCEHALAVATSQYCSRNGILRRFPTTTGAFFLQSLNMASVPPTRNSATSISMALALDQTRVIPPHLIMRNSTWRLDDIAEAFRISRNTIYQITTTSGGQAHVESQDMHYKWCDNLFGDQFHDTHTWRVGVHKVLLFDIWRDLVWLKSGGAGISAVGNTESQYSSDN
jgi:hypothetical protein